MQLFSVSNNFQGRFSETSSADCFIIQFENMWFVNFAPCKFNQCFGQHDSKDNISTSEK